MPMPDNERPPAVSETDIPSSWGFHLLQELHRMEDKLESKLDTTNARIDALDTKFEQKLDAINTRIDALDTKVEHKLDATNTRIDGLQYWYGATLAAMIVGFVTVLFAHP